MLIHGQLMPPPMAHRTASRRKSVDVHQVPSDSVRFSSANSSDPYESLLSKIQSTFGKQRNRIHRYCNKDFKEDMALVAKQVPAASQIDFINFTNLLVDSIHHGMYTLSPQNEKQLAEALIKIEPDVVRQEILIQLMSETRYTLPKAAAPAMFTLAEGPLLDQVIHAGANSHEDICRQNALTLLHKHTNADTRNELLLKLTMDNNTTIRNQALEKLTAISNQAKEAESGAQLSATGAEYPKAVYDGIQSLQKLGYWHDYIGSGSVAFKAALDLIHDKSQQNALFRAYKAMGPLCGENTTSPQMVAFSQSLAQIPDPNLRTAMIETLVKSSNSDVRCAAAHAILTVPDETRRNRLIEQIGYDSHWFNLRVAKQLLPYITDHDKKAELASILQPQPLGSSPLYYINPADATKLLSIAPDGIPIPVKMLPNKPVEIAMQPTPPEVWVSGSAPLAPPSPPNPQDELSEKIHQLANQIADQQRELYQNNPTVRQVLKSTYPHESSLPSGRAIADRFKRLAQKSVREKKGFFGKLIWRKRDELKAKELTRTLLQVARDTGNYFLPENFTTRNLEQVVAIHDQFVTLNQEIDRLEVVLQNQTLMKAHAEMETQKQIAELGVAEKAENLSEAEAQRYAKMYQDYLKERQQVCDASLKTTTGQISETRNQLKTTYRKLINAIIYATLDNSKQAVDQVKQKVDALGNQKAFLDLLDHGEGLRFQTLSELHDAQAQKDKEATLKQFMVEDDAPPATAANTQTQDSSNTKMTGK